MGDNKNLLLRSFPSVEKLLSTQEFRDLMAEYPRNLVVESIRKQMEGLKKSILISSGCLTVDISIKNLYSLVKRDMEKWFIKGVKRAINATGIILHTNLGRAPLCERAKKRVEDILKSYCSLEIDVETGKRGMRHTRIEELLSKLTGAEAALVVNNDSAAVLLVLSVMAKGKEVIVSRGELVEIGGGFRVPEIILRSGCQLIEVGTTNKTRLSDYKNAIRENTAMILKVHPSNFKITGFTESVPISELRELAGREKLPLFYDQGNGLMEKNCIKGFQEENTIKEIVSDGADIVAFSGDKLLGGPQAGIILGKKDYIDLIKKDDMMRALRVDKIILAALEATIEEYLFGNPRENIPVLNMLGLSLETIKDRAIYIKNQLSHIKNYSVEVIEGQSEVGGGAFPDLIIPSFLVAINSSDGPEKLQEELRKAIPAVYARIFEEQLVLDMRTVKSEDMEELLAVIQIAMNKCRKS